ncbi:MAG: 23S rRNA methyltransferase [Gammaproteobacteria bacterium]|nr:MAG: 23S rRNA methyltransferase [Gammaproteobacteria bacterium]
MKRSKSSAKWLDRHFNDEYVKKARQLGLRSRAVFKLMEIDEKYNLFSANQRVVDLGSAPGGWSEYVVKKIGKSGVIVATDILPMDKILGVKFVQGDFSCNETLDKLTNLIDNSRFDVVLSDMAPNMSGVKAIDQPKSEFLNELALDFAIKTLKKDGNFICKTFAGAGFESFYRTLKNEFISVRTFKPKSSRSHSAESFILAFNKKI